MSNFVNKVYNSRFAPEFSVSILKEISAQIQRYVYENGKEKKTSSKIYVNLKMNSFLDQTQKISFRKF